MVPIQQDFVLSPCTVDDVEDLIKVQSSAFADDYFGNFTFPKTIPEDVMVKWLRDRFTKMLSKPDTRFFKITEVSSGKMAAWARWIFPHTFSEEEKLEREREKAKGKSSEWPQGANLEVCDAKFGGLERLKDKYVDPTDTYGESACSEDYLEVG